MLSPTGVARAARGVLRGELARQAFWLTWPYGTALVIRLAANVVLAHLLAPEMFGVMVLINTLRTGIELLSDIGIGQSVVRSPNARDQHFLDSAFTVQFGRGVVLTLLALLAAIPLGHAYNNPDLPLIIAVSSSTFLLTGLQSPDIFLIQRDMRLVQRSIFDVTAVIAFSVLTIGFALWLDNVWALVLGLVLGTAFTTAMTYAFAPFRWPRLSWHPEYGAEILHFGKWVFLSTALYFAAISADKIYFSAVLPLAVVGIYGVSRTFSDMLSALAQRLGSFLVFPRVVELRERRGELAVAFRQKRRLALGAIAAATAVALAGSDELMLLLYDQRYHGAAFILPVLMAGVWFAILAAFSEATLFGLDRPRASAVGNAAKFVIMIAGLPLLVPAYGVFAGLLVLLAAEVGRWAVLLLALWREQLGSVRDDLMLTVLIVVVAVPLKLALAAIGLVPTFAEWWALGALVHG